MMASGEHVLRWHGASAGFLPPEEPGEIWAVDSWLVDESRVRAFGAHERRFGRACGALAGISRARTRDFLLAAMARIPSRGRWFPRAELVGIAGNPRLQFRIRPAPPRADSVRLWISPSPDARTNPAVKGPDLDWLAAQRKSAVAAGADEAVLLSRDGHVLEGSTTSILWWRGDTLCLPPEDGRLLPGTTRKVLLDAAVVTGVPVSFTSVPPARLGGLEVWAVNALHGIRPVTAWVGSGIAPGPANRAPRWQVYLDDLAREVTPGPAEAVG
ncbi:MAG: aminotransferase class IV [Actinobacteria bacterium]|nr:aminotransferase class IV [Actinomycetota bacterium]